MGLGTPEGVLIVLGFLFSVVAVSLCGILALRHRKTEDELWSSVEDLYERVEAIDDANGSVGHLLYLDRMFDNQVRD